MQTTLDSTDTGLDVVDLEEHSLLATRPLRPRDAALEIEGLRRLSRAFVENPDTILQELVDAAVALCGADSAGISLQQPHQPDEKFWLWVATAGDYAHFLNATLPRTPSACGITLERNRPQRFLVNQSFFDLMGVTAPLVTDGILLPWQADGARGTIWIMAHTREAAFDREDLRLMQVLADFAAMAIRQQRQQQALVEQAKSAAAASMANQLAHEINNPLQSLTNLVFLAAQGSHGEVAGELAEDLAPNLERLTILVRRLLALPFEPTS